MKKLYGVLICFFLLTIISSARIIEIADAGITDKLKAVIAAKNAGGGACACNTVKYDTTASGTTGDYRMYVGNNQYMGSRFTTDVGDKICEFGVYFDDVDTTLDLPLRLGVSTDLDPTYVVATSVQVTTEDDGQLVVWDLSAYADSLTGQTTWYAIFEGPGTDSGEEIQPKYFDTDQAAGLRLLQYGGVFQASEHGTYDMAVKLKICD